MSAEDRCVIVKKSVVVKPGNIPEIFRQWPLLFPQELHQYIDNYTYAFIPGRQATEADVPKVLEIMGRTLWSTRSYDDYFLDPSIVCKYADHVLDQCKAKEILPIHQHVVDRALEIILKTQHPRCVNCHGDLTLENIIISDDNNSITFIDPAGHRGMITPANDRGKLLQSLVMRWEHRQFDRYPWSYPNPLPEWATPIDWAFLVTHWVRLMRFWPEFNTVSGLTSLAMVRP